MAQRAAEALRRSRDACLTAPVGVPTWTGRSGGAGAPPQQQQRRPRFGTVANSSLLAARSRASANPAAAAAGGLQGSAVGGGAVSSEALLARIRQRGGPVAAEGSSRARAAMNGTAGGTSAGPSGGTSAGPSAAVTDAADSLTREVVSFLSSAGGQASTSTLVQGFRNKVCFNAFSEFMLLSLRHRPHITLVCRHRRCPRRRCLCFVRCYVRWLCVRAACGASRSDFEGRLDIQTLLRTLKLNHLSY